MFFALCVFISQKYSQGGKLLLPEENWENTSPNMFQSANIERKEKEKLFLWKKKIDKSLLKTKSIFFSKHNWITFHIVFLCNRLSVCICVCVCLCVFIWFFFFEELNKFTWLFIKPHDEIFPPIISEVHIVLYTTTLH